MLNVNTVRLLTLQPIRGCNLRCRYCYLERRQDVVRMSPETLRRIVSRLVDENLPGPELAISWHLGEPLAAGKAFFPEAFRITADILGKSTRVGHSVQTNATLLDAEWARMFKEHNVAVGVSLDGPATLHDRNRVHADGSGTHALVMRGVEHLLRQGITPTVICVLTPASLEHPIEIHDFFNSHGLTRISFNLEETDGAHASSFSSTSPGWQKTYKDFLRAFFAASQASGSKIAVRDMSNIETWLVSGQARASGAALPFHHLSVNAEGGFSTYSPELLSATHPDYGDFILGDVRRDSITRAVTTGKGARLWAEIKKGLLLCKARCPLFGACGGGYPSNKLFENGSFATTATTACQAAILLPYELANCRDETGRDGREGC